MDEDERQTRRLEGDMKGQSNASENHIDSDPDEDDLDDLDGDYVQLYLV